MITVLSIVIGLIVLYLVLTLFLSYLVQHIPRDPVDDKPDWSLSRVDSMKHNGVQMNIPVTRTIGVYFEYISAWATPDGIVHFRPDIYGLDAPRGTYAQNY